MNSNDYDDWNRAAILQALLEYRDKSEQYRSELIYTETQLGRVTAERNRLREENEQMARMLAEPSEVVVERNRLREAVRYAKRLAVRIQECSIEPDKVYLYADRIKALQEARDE